MGKPPSPEDHELIDGPTPAGGAYAVAYWKDAKGNPCAKDVAVAAEVIEFDKRGAEIVRTYAALGAKP